MLNQHQRQGSQCHGQQDNAPLDQDEQDHQNDPNQLPHIQEQQDNQYDPNQLPNIQGQLNNHQRPILMQMIQNNMTLAQDSLTNQNRIFLVFAKELISLNRKMDNMLLEIRRSNNAYRGEPSSFAHQYIFDHLDFLDWNQITSLFAELIIRYNDQNRERQIPIVNRDEKRMKSLMLHKLDIYWDQLEPFLTDATIQDIINTLHLNPDDRNPI